jgi:type IV secretory pathway VirJ component
MTRSALLFLVFTVAAASETTAEPIKKDLPVIVTKPEHIAGDAPIVLLVSGDGGWYKFEQTISNQLAEKGIPVLGLDSRKYFWEEKTPESTAADIALLLTSYGKEWNRHTYVLAGYSLGAEIVPFIYNYLPEKIKPSVFSAVLLSPDTNTDFEIHVSNMLGMGNKNNTYDVPAEIKKMNRVRTLIIYGSGEKTKVPELLSGTPVIIKKIPGDHHYKFDVPLILKTMEQNGIIK